MHLRHEPACDRTAGRYQHSERSIGRPLIQQATRLTLLTLQILAFLSLTAGSPSRAQNVYGSIVGSVTDASGAAIPSATVTLVNLGTSERRVTQTTTSGGYQFLTLVPGRYEVDVE